METIEYKNHKIHIYHDEYASSPREDCNLSTFAFFHKRYELANETEFDSSEFDYWEEMEAKIHSTRDILYCAPVSMYDHSGISLSLGSPTCRFDSGYIGFAFITKQAVREAYMVKRITAATKKRAIEALKQELSIYDDFLNENCFRFTVEDENDEYVDDCCGFIGFDHEESGLLDSAKNSIEWNIKQKRKRHFQALKTWIKNSVPLNKRAQLAF